MEDHFRSMLAPALDTSRPLFLPAERFEGSRPGYIFQMNSQGLGYYLDHAGDGGNVFEGNEEGRKKRKLDDMSSDSRAISAQKSIEQLLEESEKSNIQMLDAENLKKILLTLEKKITKNQQLRMKYANEPEKFMDSEIELYDELNNLYALAASPEYYDILVNSGSVTSVLGMIAHENTDVSLAAVGLLQELTDADTILDHEDSTVVLIDELLKGQILELLVQNLSRLDEKNEEDSQGVHDTLSTLENFLEIRPSLAKTMGEKTHIMKYLLNRLSEKSFDQNKLHCSELLSVLLQNESFNAKRLINIAGVDDGLDTLLQILSQYRKRDPADIEEQECVQNLFLCLCTALMHVDNQHHFRSCEGMELLIRFLKENKFAAGCACRAVTYAVLNNRENCERFINTGGFRYIFPLFMGRGFPPHSKKAVKREIEESSIATISQLCLHLHNVSEKDVSHRLLAKFVENDFEKTDRTIELFVKYKSHLANFDLQNEREIVHLSQLARLNGPQGEAAELELEMLQDEDAQYVKRMDAGQDLLQQVAITLAFVCVYNNSNTSLISKIQNKLAVENSSLVEVLNILREFAAHIDLTSGDNNSAEEGDLEVMRKQRQTLIEWCACLQHITKD